MPLIAVALERTQGLYLILADDPGTLSGEPIPKPANARAKALRALPRFKVVAGVLACRHSLALKPVRFAHDLALFARYENFDTQFRMDVGDVNLPEFDRDAWVVGGTYWLDPDVALKVDYSHVRSQSQVIPAPRSLNIGLGWWF